MKRSWWWHPPRDRAELADRTIVYALGAYWGWRLRGLYDETQAIRAEINEHQTRHNPDDVAGNLARNPHWPTG